jgi:hypothetical protein
MDRNLSIWGLRTLGAVFVAAAAATAFVSSSGWVRWLVVAIFVVAGAVCFIGAEVHKKRLATEIRDSAPRLVVEDRPNRVVNLNPRLDEVTSFFSTDIVVTAVSGTGTPVDGRERIHVVQLNVSNTPVLRKSKEKAEGVYLSIRYLRDEVTLHTLNGRWSTDDQNLHRESAQRASQKIIDPNGNPEVCDIACKFLDDDQCYAIDDTLRFHPGGWRQYPLGTGPVEVELTANQSGYDPVVTRWLLTHDGPGGEPHLEPL